MSTTVSPKIVLRTGTLVGIESSALDVFLSQIPAGLFASVGVIAPVPARLPDDTLLPNNAVLELNGRALDSLTLAPGMEPDGIIDSLRENAAEIIAPEMVDYLLVKLRSRVPALVDTALATSTQENILSTLRTRLQKGESIKNLSGILEEMLAESTS